MKHLKFSSYTLFSFKKSTEHNVKHFGQKSMFVLLPNNYVVIRRTNFKSCCTWYTVVKYISIGKLEILDIVVKFISIGKLERLDPVVKFISIGKYGIPLQCCDPQRRITSSCSNLPYRHETTVHPSLTFANFRIKQYSSFKLWGSCVFFYIIVDKRRTTDDDGQKVVT